MVNYLLHAFLEKGKLNICNTFTFSARKSYFYVTPFVPLLYGTGLTALLAIKNHIFASPLNNFACLSLKTQFKKYPFE